MCGTLQLFSLPGTPFSFAAFSPMSPCFFRSLHLLTVSPALVPFLVRGRLADGSDVSTMLHFHHDEDYCCLPAFDGACKSGICRDPPSPPPPRSPTSPQGLSRTPVLKLLQRWTGVDWFLSWCAATWPVGRSDERSL